MHASSFRTPDFDSLAVRHDAPSLLSPPTTGATVDSMHLETAKEARLMMNNEFIIPVTDETRSIRLFPDESKRHSLPGVGLSTCLKPRVHFSPVGVISIKPRQQLLLHSPQIPLGTLKEKAISMLTEAVQGGGMHIRDPVGGSVEYQFVPILKLVGTLLVMGVLTSDEVRLILLLVDPNVFGEPQEAAAAEEGKAAPPAAAAAGGEKEEASSNEEKAVEAGEEDGKDGKTLPKGLLGKTLPEPVKRQVGERRTQRTQTGRQTDRQTVRQADGDTHRQTDIEDGDTDRQAERDRDRDRQTDRQTETLTDRQTDTQTDRHWQTHIDTHIHRHSQSK